MMSCANKEAALEFMKQNKSNDLEVSDLPTEDVKVDGIPRHVYYTVKSIQSLHRTSTDRRFSKLLPENLVSVCVFAKRLL
jgi:hypothetical protein